MKDKNTIKNMIEAEYDDDSFLEEAKRSIRPERFIDANEIFAQFSTPFSYTEEEMKQTTDRHSISKIFHDIVEKFKDKYNFFPLPLEIIYDKTTGQFFSSYSHTYDRNIIFVDSLFTGVIYDVFIIIFLWSCYKDSEKHYVKFYQYICSLFYAAIVDKNVFNIFTTLQYVKEELPKENPAFNVATSCYYFTLYFIVAHEMAHSYLKYRNCELSEMEEEIEADKIAYQIVLEVFKDERTIDIEDRELLDYCYYAPLMFCDFLEMYYLFRGSIDDKFNHIDNIHPVPQIRKEILENVLKNYEFSFLSEQEQKDAENIYHIFDEMAARYIIEVILKKKDGSFEILINYLRGLKHVNKKK